MNVITTVRAMTNLTEPALGTHEVAHLANAGKSLPFDFYEELRAQGSPLWDDQLNAWLILSFEQCVQVGRNEIAFGSIYAGDNEILAKVKGGRAALTISQGEEHAKLRRFHLRLLNEHAKQSYIELHVAPIVRHVLKGVSRRAGVELFEDVFAQIAPRVICSLMGMPFDDDLLMRRILTLNEPIVSFIGSSYDASLVEKALAASYELNEILLPYVRSNRTKPGDNFIGRVWRDAPEYYGDLTEDDALAICRDLFLTGSDTTIHASSNAMYLLLGYPEIRQKIRASPEKLKSVIEESLRLFASVQIRHRRATQNCELGGKAIAAGDMVILVHAAANRDENKYQCPKDINLDRQTPHDHLTFGRGPRSCVGAILARAEVELTLKSILEMFPDISLDLSKEAPSFDGFFTRSYRPLHVRLRRGSVRANAPSISEGSYGVNS